MEEKKEEEKKDEEEEMEEEMNIANKLLLLPTKSWEKKL